MDEMLAKISAIVVFQHLIAVFKDNITRWLIKTFFTNSEFPISKWYTPAFLSTLWPGRRATYVGRALVG